MSEADPWSEGAVYCEDSSVVATLKMGKDTANQCGWSLDVGKDKKLILSWNLQEGMKPSSWYCDVSPVRTVSDFWQQSYN